MQRATKDRTPRRIAALAIVPLAAIVLGACGPTPAPAPTAPRASATVNSQGARTWPTTTDTKQRPPTPTNCTGSYSTAVETCHLTYKFYNLDTTSPAAQNKISGYGISHMTQNDCRSNLNSFHSSTPANPTSWPSLSSQYPGMSPLGENLYCMFFGDENLCASAQLGAQNAIQGWINSLPHHQTMDAFAGKWVNAAAVCIPASQGGHGVYVAVAQFHY